MRHDGPVILTQGAHAVRKADSIALRADEGDMYSACKSGVMAIDLLITGTEIGACPLSVFSRRLEILLGNHRVIPNVLIATSSDVEKGAVLGIFIIDNHSARY